MKGGSQMALFDKFISSAIEAKKIIQKHTTDVVDYAEDNYANMEWYKSVKEVGAIGKQFIDEAGISSKVILEEVSKTDVGKKIGSRTRSFAAILSELPIISLPADYIKSKNGIKQLYELIKEEPRNAERYIWLAEAMKRVERDIKIYSNFRTIIDPQSLVFKEAIKTAISLGNEKSKSDNVVLKNAYHLAVNEVKKNPKSSKNLHVLSRVYLLMGDLRESIKFSKLAIMADPEYKLPYITIARAYFEGGHYNNCNKAIQKAIANNLNYAYEIKSNLILIDDDREFSKKVETYSNLRDEIRSEDRVEYLGWEVEELSFVQIVGREQIQKMNGVIQKAKKYINQL